MRSILQFSVHANEATAAEDVVMKSLAEYGWTKPDLGLSREDFVELVTTVITATERAKRDLPVSPESQFIQDAIDRRFGTGRDAGRTPSTKRAVPTPPDAQARFVPFSFERHCLEQALLILTQIDKSERSEAYQREMTVVVGPEFSTYGVIFAAQGATGTARSDISFQVRLRSNDLTRLQTATASFTSALNPGKSLGGIRRNSSPSVSVGRRRSGGAPFWSDFSRMEIRSVANEKLFSGRVIPITGRFSLFRQTVSDRSARVLAGISLILVGISALLYWRFPVEGWWNWTEQLTGRLATGAFGALLIDGAMDYTALRKSLMAGTGPVTHGAVIHWTRA